MIVVLAAVIYYIITQTDFVRNPFVPPEPTPTPTRTSLSYSIEAEDMYREGRLDKAIAAYGGVIEREPDNAEAYAAVARLLALREKAQDAVEQARKAVELDGENPRFLAILAMALDWDGQYDEAHAIYSLAARRMPGDSAARAGVELCAGLRALTESDRLEAAQRFEAVLELDPTNERAARELAEMRRQATNDRKGLLARLLGKKE